MPMNETRPNDEPARVNSYRGGWGRISEYEAIDPPGISLAKIPGARIWINKTYSPRIGWVLICVQELNDRKRRGRRYDVEIPLDQPFKLLHRRWIARDTSILQPSGIPVTKILGDGPERTVERKAYFPIVKVPALEIKVLALWQGRMRPPVLP